MRKIKRWTAVVLSVLLGLFSVITGAAAPQSKKAIIVVPGISGSELYLGSTSDLSKVWVGPAIFKIGSLACDENGKPVAGNIIAYDKDDNEYGTANAYGSLVNALKDTYGSAYDVRFFPYDWRLSSAQSAKSLAQFVDKAGYDSVTLVAHSMGGLVCSSYASNSENKSKINKVITIGTPFLGTPKTLETFETGKMVDSLKTDGITGDIFKELVKNFPALYELLPSEQYYNYTKHNTTAVTLTDAPLTPPEELQGYQATADFTAQRSFARGKPLLKNAQIYHDSLYSGEKQALLSGVDAFFIAGFGRATGAGYAYSQDEDGKLSDLADVYRMADGDGLVPVLSATIGGKTPKDHTFYFKSEHQALISDEDVISLIKSIIDKAPVPNTENDRTNSFGWGDMRIKLTGRANISMMKDRKEIAAITSSACKVADYDAAAADYFAGYSAKTLFLNGADAEISVNCASTGVFDLEIDLYDSNGTIKTVYAFSDVAINSDITVTADLNVKNEPQLLITAQGGSKTVQPDIIIGERIQGDSNTDGKVNVLDVLLIQKHLAGIIALNHAERAAADMTDDDELNIRDVLLIQKELAMSA